MEAPWNCPQGKNHGKVERDQSNDWLPFHGSTVRYVQLRRTQSAREGFYLFCLVYTPLGNSQEQLGDVKNNVCRTSPGPIAIYTHKTVKLLCFHCPFHNYISKISPLFLLQKDILIHHFLWPGDQEHLPTSQSVNNTIFTPKIVPLFSCVTHLDKGA